MSLQIRLILKQLVTMLTLQSLGKEMDSFYVGIEVSFLWELKLTKCALEGFLAKVKSLVFEELAQGWNKHTTLVLVVHLVEALESFE